jgi:glycerophosphoryl diester phosphodiesterase
MLDFTPTWLSPHYSITDEALVKICREKGMRIVPWTVDRPENIKEMLSLGVDAIISNYPDRVLSCTRND